MSHLLITRLVQPPEPVIDSVQALLQSQPDLTPDFLQQLTYAAVLLNDAGYRHELQLMVNWAIKQSYCDRHTVLDRLKLLQLAWQIQQRLWSQS